MLRRSSILRTNHHDVYFQTSISNLDTVGSRKHWKREEGKVDKVQIVIDCGSRLRIRVSYDS